MLPSQSRASSPSPTTSTNDAVDPPTDATLHDVIIIGAGPCGLAIAARLCEHTPSALFTDSEHARYHWIRKHGRRMSLMRGKRGCVSLASPGVSGLGAKEQQEGGRAEHAGQSVCADAGGRDVANDRGVGVDRSANHEPTNKHGDGVAQRQDQRHTTNAQPRFKTLVLDASADTWLASWNRLFSLLDITHLRSPMFFHVDPRDRDGLLAYAHEQQRRDELREIKDCVGKEVSKHRRKKRQAERMGREVGQG